MGKGGSDGSLLPTLVQQSSRGAQLQKLAFMGFLSLLLTVNLLYFVKTHAKMESLTGEVSAHGNHCTEWCQVCLHVLAITRAPTSNVGGVIRHQKQTFLH